MQLWGALGGAAEEAGVQLTAPVRSALWRLLAAEPGLHFTLPRQVHAGWSLLSVFRGRLIN